MERLRRIFNGILWRPRRAPPFRLAMLDDKVRQQVLKEAKFLLTHAVDVQPLEPDEIPGPPRRADED